MNIKLTLGERLKDLRVERSLKLETLAEQTGLSKSALSKYESDDVTDLSIYAVTTLAEFYGVTTDYLLGVTENKKRPDAVLSDLHLSDGAVDVLRNGNFNHRLLCELLEHPDFSRWMTDLEICVDGLVSDRIRDMNAMVEATRQELEKRYHADAEDLTMRTLKAAQINEDEYFGQILAAYREKRCYGRTGECTPLVPLQACAGWAETISCHPHPHILLPQNKCLPELLAVPFPHQPEPRCNTLDFANKVVCHETPARFLWILPAIALLPGFRQ